MPDLLVGEELQSYLVTAGIGHSFTDAPSTSYNRVALYPRDGAPQPVKGSEHAVITVRPSMIGVPSDLEAWVEESYMDIIVRADNNGRAQAVQTDIRDLLHPIDSHGGRKQWQMAGLLVECSRVWRPDQPIGSDSISYDREQSFAFYVRRKVLAGLTLP